MNLLLDTNVLLWLYAGSDRLGPKARGVIEGANLLSVSVASLWEVALKVSLGKLDGIDGLGDRARQDGILRLDISDDHLTVLQTLEWPVSGHRDPFDRLLVSQALAERLTLATADLDLRTLYGIPVLDAIG